jgi:hypothetical protein
MIQELNSVDQYCCLFHIVHQHTQVLLSKEATVCARGRPHVHVPGSYAMTVPVPPAPWTLRLSTSTLSPGL